MKNLELFFVVNLVILFISFSALVGSCRTSLRNQQAPTTPSAVVVSYERMWGPVKMLTTDNLEPFDVSKITGFLYDGHIFRHDKDCEVCPKIEK